MESGYYCVFECVEPKDGKSPMQFLSRGQFDTRRAACEAADAVRNRIRTAAEPKPKAAIYSPSDRLIQQVG